LNAATRTADEWRESLHRFWGKLVGWADLSGVKARPEAVVARSLRGYPMAKRALIDRGLSPEAVKSMPVTQVVMLYTMQTYQDLRDEVHKWCYVPYPEAVERRQALEDLCRRVEEECEILPVARVFLPAVWACHTAVVRTDREIALLRVIEALRMHGAAHQGRLPEKLADVQEAPIPVDPVTGKAFGYQLDGDTAYLQGPPLPGAPLNCEIKMAGK
jgi:hypothetical protein